MLILTLLGGVIKSSKREEKKERERAEVGVGAVWVMELSSIGMDGIGFFDYPPFWKFCNQIIREVAN
jgi:hypothetical protein